MRSLVLLAVLIGCSDAETGDSGPIEGSDSEMESEDSASESEDSSSESEDSTPQGDCVDDCSGNCVDAALFGDGTCHDDPAVANFACPDFLFDNGDCATDPDEAICNGGFYDCSGNCADGASLGDGVCDVGTGGGVDYDCAFLYYDHGDCPHSAPGDQILEGRVGGSAVVDTVNGTWVGHEWFYARYVHEPLTRYCELDWVAEDKDTYLARTSPPGNMNPTDPPSNCVACDFQFTVTYHTLTGVSGNNCADVGLDSGAYPANVFYALGYANGHMYTNQGLAWNTISYNEDATFDSGTGELEYDYYYNAY